MDPKDIKTRLSKSNIVFGDTQGPSKPQLVRKVLSLGVNEYRMVHPVVNRRKDTSDAVNEEELQLKEKSRKSMLASMEKQYAELDSKKKLEKIMETEHPFQYDTRQRVVPLRDRLRTPADLTYGVMELEEILPKDELMKQKLESRKARVEELKADEDKKKELENYLQEDESRYYEGRKKFERSENAKFELALSENKFGADESGQAYRSRAQAKQSSAFNRDAILAKNGGNFSLHNQRRIKNEVPALTRSIEYKSDPMNIGERKESTKAERQAEAERYRKILDDDRRRFSVMDKAKSTDELPEWWDPDMHSPRTAMGAGEHDVRDDGRGMMTRVKTGMRVEPTGWTSLQIGEQSETADAEVTRAKALRYKAQLEAQKAMEDERLQMKRAKSRAGNLQMLESVPPYIDRDQWEQSGIQ